jgi:hypothetical protein
MAGKSRWCPLPESNTTSNSLNNNNKYFYLSMDTVKNTDKLLNSEMTIQPFVFEENRSLSKAP